MKNEDESEENTVTPARCTTVTWGRGMVTIRQGGTRVDLTPDGSLALLGPITLASSSEPG